MIIELVLVLNFLAIKIHDNLNILIKLWLCFKNESILKLIFYLLKL